MLYVKLRHLLIIFCIFLFLGCGSSDGKSFWQSSKDVASSAINMVLSKNTSSTESNDKDAVSSKLNFLVDRGANVTPTLLIRDLELKPNRIYEDYIDLGTCYLWAGNYVKAAEAYEIAAQISSTPQQRGGALYNKASTIAFVSIKDSLPVADLASKILPDNVEIARLRFILHQKSDNQLGTAVAQDHLSKVDPSTTGHEVISPALIIGAVVVVGMISTTHVTVYALTPPEDRAKIIAPLMEGYRDAITSGVRPGSITFSKKLLEGAI